MRVFCKTGNLSVEELTIEDVERLPQFVLDTLAEGCLAVHDGSLYGVSVEHIEGQEEL